MRYGLKEIIGSPEPDPLLTLEQAKLYLRQDIDAEDSLIRRKVLAATRVAEQYTRRVFVSRQFELTLDEFPRRAWVDSWAPQDEDTWPPRFGSLTAPRRFPEAISLPLAPLVTVDKIEYASTTLDGSPESPVIKTVTGVADTSAWPPRVLPQYGKCWPEVSRVPEAVKVLFTAGYGTPDDVPEDIKAGVEYILGTMHEHREEVVTGTIATRLPFASEALLSPYRVFPL